MGVRTRRVEYQKWNFGVLLALTCLANVEQKVSPWLIAAYVAGDTCAMLAVPGLQRTTARRNQMIAHHLCTGVLCVTTALGGVRPHDHLFRHLVNLEISSLCLMARRLWSVANVPNVAEIVWVSTRLAYLPWILRIIETSEFPHMSPVAEYTNKAMVWMIFFLGVTWTAEMVSVRVNPLVITAAASFMPIRRPVHLPLLVTSALHHTWWELGNAYHLLDLCMVKVYVVWAVCVCWRSVAFWACLVLVAQLRALTTHVTDRSWTNAHELLPHALLHYVAGLGVHSGLGYAQI